MKYHPIILPVLTLISVVAASRSLAETHYVSPAGNDAGMGTIASPWRTIQHGVDSLKPGDTLLLDAGTYREAVTLHNGGSPAAPITIAAASGAHVVISGADRLGDGWSKADDTNRGIYFHEWALRFPISGPNDLTHPGDREHQLTGRAEQVIHSGRLLRQVLEKGQLAPGTFYVDLDAHRLYVWLRGSDNPAESEVEASARSNWLSAAAPVSSVHLRGLVFRYAANHAQRGAFSIGQGGRKTLETQARNWIIEDCIFEKANGPGASLSGEGHLLRRCQFRDNGQLGFGTSRCDNTHMERCEIYRNNTKGYSTGWEAGGLKVTMSRHFVFDHCRSVNNRGTGIWFDIGNEDCEVGNCYIADNDEAGIFCEISYGLKAHDNLIVNNANNGEQVGGSWGSAGITLSSSEGCTLERNTIVGNRDGIDFREQDRTTPRIDAPDGSPEVRILNKNHMIRDNVIAYSQAYNIGLWMDTNFFGPHPSGGDTNRPVFENPATLNIRFEHNRLWPLPGRANYLYGVPWRPKSRKFISVSEFSSASGIPDNSEVVEPHFKDLQGGDFSTVATP